MRNDQCGVASASAVLADAWSVLILRDVARGRCRFDQLLAESGISRKVLTQRLGALVDAGVLLRVAYREHPPRFEYLLSESGRATLPILAALQEWGDTWLLGDGTTTAVAGVDSAEAQRVDSLVGTRVPRLAVDPIADAQLTVVYCYPGTGLPQIDGVPGGPGCTLESCTYRDRLAEFEALGAAVVGVSTQSADEQRDFAQANGIRFPLVSDADLGFTLALRLPTFRLSGTPRLKRLTLVVDSDREIRGVLFPIRDVTGSVEDALSLVRSVVGGRVLDRSGGGDDSATAPGSAGPGRRS